MRQALASICVQGTSPSLKDGRSSKQVVILLVSSTDLCYQPFRGINHYSGTWSSTRSSVDTGSPMKLTHSRSWQTIRTGSSFHQYLEDNGVSDVSSQSTITADGQRTIDGNQKRQLGHHANRPYFGLVSSMSTTILASRGSQAGKRDSVDLTVKKDKEEPQPKDSRWRLTGLKGYQKFEDPTNSQLFLIPKDSLSSISNKKAAIELSPRTLRKRLSPLSAISYSNWKKLDKKHDNRLPSSKSYNVFNDRHLSLASPHQFKENNGSQTPPGASSIHNNEKPNLSATQSKIASLRQIFDRPKSNTASPPRPGKLRHVATTPIQTTPLRNKPRKLQKSATIQMLGSDESLKSNRGSHDLDNVVTKCESQAFSSPTTSTGKKNSPLKAKIGLFETLSHQSRDGSPKSMRSEKAAYEKSSLQSYKQKISGVKKSLHMKGALRRLSTSWKGSSEENIDVQNRITQTSIKPKDAWWVGRDLAASKKAPVSRIPQPSPVAKASASSTTNKEEPQTEKLTTKKPFSVPRGKKCISARQSPAQPGFNVDGEGGAQPQRKQHSKLTNAAYTQPNVSKTSISEPPIVIHDLNNRRSSISNFPTSRFMTDTRTHARRRISRSSGPFVANAYCKIEEPKPVRVGELKRLVSLCKDKVTRRVSGANS